MASNLLSNKSKDNLPWVEKYRPEQLKDIKGQKYIIRVIKKFKDREDFPHLLFYGPPGTGKTSTIISAIHEIYGNNYQFMVLEMNASDKRGIDSVRNEILDFVNKKGYQNKFK